MNNQLCSLKKLIVLCLIMGTKHDYLLSMSAWEFYAKHACCRNLLEVFRQNFLRPAGRNGFTSLNQLVINPEASTAIISRSLPVLESITINPSEITEKRLQAINTEHSTTIEEVIVTDVIFQEEYELLQKYFPSASLYILRNGRKDSLR